MAERLEDRLTDALRRHAGEDERVAGMAAGARARASRRARRRTAGAVVAAVLAVAGVPTVVALTGSPSVDGPAPAPAASSEDTPAPDAALGDVRVESWRGLTLTVPSGWGYNGEGSDWCAADGSRNRPAVARPEGGALAIACGPRLSYGVHFIDGSAIRWARDSGEVWQYPWDSPDQVKMYPEDAWLGLFRVGDHALMVVTRDEATTRAVLETAREIRGADPNGCAPRDGEDAASGDGERWSVCRYNGDGWLVQSELLSSADSESLQRAIADAPPGPVSGPPCSDPGQPKGGVRVGSAGDVGSAWIRFQERCPVVRGVFLSGSQRQLTEDVLYWAISPGWSGAVDGSVPLPEEFRQP